MLLDEEHFDFELRHLALSALIIVLGLSFQVFTLPELGDNLKIYGFNFIYDQVLSNLEEEFSHMVVNFCEVYCEIRIKDLRLPLYYTSHFFIAPL